MLPFSKKEDSLLQDHLGNLEGMNWKVSQASMHSRKSQKHKILFFHWFDGKPFPFCWEQVKLDSSYKHLSGLETKPSWTQGGEDTQQNADGDLFSWFNTAMDPAGLFFWCWYWTSLPSLKQDLLNQDLAWEFGALVEMSDMARVVRSKWVSKNELRNRSFQR